MGFSDCSSVDSSTISTTLEGKNNIRLNLKATELRLGLPGSQSPERIPELSMMTSANLDEKPLFPLHSLKEGSFLLSQKASGSKRGFSDAMDGFSERKYTGHTEVNAMLSPRPTLNYGAKCGAAKEKSVSQPTIVKELIMQKVAAANETAINQSGAASNTSTAPAAKAQVVGWPPIRSFRKNSLATVKNEEVDGKVGPGSLFVKVSMDGAPYLRKVDLRTYSVYQELSSALEKMFSCFTIGQYGSHGASGRERLSESKLKDLLHGSEYVLTYEDKDNDWMLVGDVPWEMFIETCKRLRIMKSADAIGLGEKCRN
jgi:auxin-responsive protein IAA